MAYINRPKKKDNRPRDFRRKERDEIYNTSLWMKLRRWQRSVHPLCQICEAEGKTVAGQHVHHVVSFMTADDPVERDALAYDPENLLTVCGRCHHRLHDGDLKGCRTIKEIIGKLK